MSDETHVAEERYAFGRALAGKVSRWWRGERWKEDAIQQVWCVLCAPASRQAWLQRL